MIETTIPLLNAQQQGMAQLVPTTTRAELVAQIAQSVVVEKMNEDSKKLAEVEEDQDAHGVSRDLPHNSQEYPEQERKKREKQAEVYAETAPSYHNPLAGFLVSEKV